MDLTAEEASRLLQFMRQSHDDGGRMYESDWPLVERLIAVCDDPATEQEWMGYRFAV